METVLKITIISDNTVYNKHLKSEWGFSCLVEVENTSNPEPEPFKRTGFLRKREVQSRVKILFDTGASSDVLFYNMEKMNINPKDIEAVFISHDHWDHTGGLNDFLEINNKVKLYVPQSFSSQIGISNVIRVKESIEIYKNIFSTGELLGIEQSMVVKLNRGLVIIVGCSHPGVGNILKASSKFGRVSTLIGGFHGFNEFEVIKDLDLVCATHCTQHKEKIKRLYPEKFVDGGTGRIIDVG